MYKTFKHSWEDKHKLFFTSDWHAYHDPNWPVPLWKSRGYNSASYSAEAIINQINAVVPEDGILYCLGDGFLNATDEMVRNWLNRIVCKNIRYLFGNHESSMYRLYREEIKMQYGIDDVEIYPIRMGNVEFIGNHAEIIVGKRRKIVLNHFPLRIWNNVSRNSWMLSGHSHGNDKGRRPECKTDKALDCGWDINKSVWSFDEIDTIMQTKTNNILDHHGE